MHCEKKQTMQRCNIWQFIYKKKELQSDVKRCKGGGRMAIYRQNGKTGWKRTCRPEESPRLVDSPTANPGPAPNLEPAKVKHDFPQQTEVLIERKGSKKHFNFHFFPLWEYHSCFTHIHNVPVVQKSILLRQGLSIVLSLDSVHHSVSAVFFSTKRCNLPMSLLSFWLHLPWFLSRLVS